MLIFLLKLAGGFRPLADIEKNVGWAKQRAAQHSEAS
jgi:hypothetical protein